jgi:hypothetical protein
MTGVEDTTEITEIMAIMDIVDMDGLHHWLVAL